jgi:hypothetical protein
MLSDQSFRQGVVTNFSVINHTDTSVGVVQVMGLARFKPLSRAADTQAYINTRHCLTGGADLEVRVKAKL